METETKFKPGDIVRVIGSRYWSCGCLGKIRGIWDFYCTPPYYLVELDQSPNPSIKCTYVCEDALEAVAE